MKRYILLFVLIGLIGLTACGRMSNPARPKNAVYPETYAVIPQ